MEDRVYNDISRSGGPCAVSDMHVNDTRWGEGHLNYIYRSKEIEQYEQPRKLWEVWQLIEQALVKTPE